MFFPQSSLLSIAAACLYKKQKSPAKIALSSFVFNCSKCLLAAALCHGLTASGTSFYFFYSSFCLFFHRHN
jgi:hypothetical protein